MKSIVSKKQVFDKLVLALREFDTTEQLVVKIAEALQLIYAELPLLIPYELSLVETEKLRYSEFYQAGPELSRYAIQIKGPKYCEYIWRDTGEWVLANEFYTPDDIAGAICKVDLLTSFPENVKELKLLLTKGYWRFLPQELPKYGGAEPADILEVLSWDPKNLLVGTKLENIEVISREEWNNLSFRETDWLQ